MVAWCTAFNTMPCSLGQVNCLEIQILSEIVFSFSLPINIVIYNGRVAHLEGNLLPLTRVGVLATLKCTIHLEWKASYTCIIWYFMFCKFCKKRQCAMMCKMVHLSRVQECRCGMSCHWNGRQSEDTYSPAFNDAYTCSLHCCAPLTLTALHALVTLTALHSTMHTLALLCMAHHLHLHCCAWRTLTLTVLHAPLYVIHLQSCIQLYCRQCGSGHYCVTSCCSASC